MGSLPDLHALSKDDDKDSICKITIKGRIEVSYCKTGIHLPHCNQHRPLKHTRSAGSNPHGCIDKKATFHQFPLERMASYSPMSSRSTRSSSTIHHQIQNAMLMSTATTSRRRESMSSSGGTSSVRRLIAVVRSTPSRFGPVYSRKLLCRNFAALCLGHAMITAAFVPLFALQGSISSWWWPPEDTSLNPTSFQLNADVGSLLLATLFALGSLSSLGTPILVHKIGSNWSLILSYTGTCVFFGVHLYPRVYTLIPGYLLMGIWLGPLAGARITFLMTLASKLSYVLSDEEEDEIEYLAGITRRELIIERLSRGLHVAQDLGLIIGNFVASLLLWYTTTASATTSPSNIKDINDSFFVLDAMFKTTGSNERICGSMACPLTTNVEYSDTRYGTVSVNDSGAYNKYVLPCKTTTMLASVFLGCSVMGVALTAAFMDHIKLFIHQDPAEKTDCHAAARVMQETFKDPRLQLAAPLSVFIGLEQGFMYADFSKSYVVCALGVANIPMVFLSLGILQSVAGFTLSMLLQHIRRYIVIVMGFVFHSCLLLVLLLWKPTGDDPALFYVIAAAWGVCNAIWDTLSFSLVISVHPDSWQAPVAHSYFFRYLGLALAFGLHGAVCNWLKLYGLAGAMVLAVTPYTWLEMRLDAQRKMKAQLSTL
ncbi:protein unc-93 homolog A [Lycorma delicatula]|uniref:protein unc-93 homolog A n=1 Tax=Lycorma delicatula TaxID=130591 RepID=UPI003F50F8CF